LNRKAARKLREFFSSFPGTSTALLLLDYDGTLADFRIDRFKARPWAGVRELLDAIQKQKKTRIAVVTGRPATEIPPMLALETPVEVWGLHGAERLYSDGRRELEVQAPAVRQALQDLRTRLKRDPLGGLFEDKPNAAVMHWRGRSPDEAKGIEKRTREIFEPLAKLDGLRLLEFSAGLELRAGRDKGGAVREIIREAGTDAPITYLGDDLTDESAFQAVDEAQASHLSVLIRRAPRKTEADVWLKPPKELREFLRLWLDAGV
jgi:trehalose 6-phosphate phosphatase